MDKIRAIAPGLELWQIKTDCGNRHWMPGWTPDRAPNGINYAMYSWGLVRDWFKAGAVAYELWNMVLDPQGCNIDALRPWPRNAPVTVDPADKKVRCTPLFGAFGSFSRFVPPGSVMVETEGASIDTLAFRTPGARIVMALRNQRSLAVSFKAGIPGAVFALEFPPESFGTLVIEK